MQLRKLAYGMGAEVSGLDLSRPLDSGAMAAVRAAWLEHLVLVFPAQALSNEEHVAFSRTLGELELHPLKSFQGAGHPEIVEISNRVIEGKRSETYSVGRAWHSDGAYTVRPPTGSLLYCRALPDVGGNTWFTNLYLAYESLSDTFRTMLDNLSVVNDMHFYYQGTGRGMRDEQTVGREAVEVPAVVQPLVRTHPETGRKSLFISPSVCRQILGMSESESAGILQYLCEHAVRPEFTYRHYWRVGDLVLWDNRCTLHLAPADYDTRQVRYLCRTTLLGEAHGKLLVAA